VGTATEFGWAERMELSYLYLLERRKLCLLLGFFQFIGWVAQLSGMAQPMF
jgi:hypothetical protein